MTIARASLPALLVVAMSALTACGNDDAATAAKDTGSTAVQTVTQTATATATATAEEPTKTATKPAAEEKTQTRAQTQTSSNRTRTTAQKPSGACPTIEVGARDGEVELTYARIVKVSNVSCPAASEIAAQWGQQQLGIGKALLPLDWECTKANVCAKGSSRVVFELVKLG